jgi:integrase
MIASQWTSRHIAKRMWRGNLQYVLPPRVAHKSEQHMSSLPWQRIPEFLAALHAAAATPRKTSGKGSAGGALGMRALTAATIKLQILTATRTAMTVEATWDEFDLDNRIWSLAGERMKGGRPFRIPLSERACEIIKAQTSTGRYVFAQTLSPKRGDRPLNPHTALRTLNELGFTGTDGRPIDRHGFRTSFVTWSKEQLYDRDLIMMAIDHVVLNRSDASYYHGDHLEQRRPIMEEWSKVCTGLWTPGEVIPFRRRG